VVDDAKEVVEDVDVTEVEESSKSELVAETNSTIEEVEPNKLDENIKLVEDEQTVNETLDTSTNEKIETAAIDTNETSLAETEETLDEDVSLLQDTPVKDNNETA